MKKERVDILEVVNAEHRENYLKNFIGKKSTMLVEEKKDMFEGFSLEYIRCYTMDKVEPGEKYNIKFVERYLDGMKVKVVK